MAKRRSPTNQIIKPEPLPEYAELEREMINEVASVTTDYIRKWVGASADSGIFLNQDRIWGTQTYQELAQYFLYAEVERDPHVKATLDSAKIEVAEIPWSMEAYLRPGEKKPSLRNQGIADFVQDCLEQTGHIETTQGITSGFPQHIYNWMGALGMGFSVLEVVYIDSKRWPKEGTRFKTFLSRDPRRFQFAVKDRSLRLRTQTEPYYGLPLSEKKFVIHRCTSTWDDPFGDALDQSLYWMWLFKRTGMKFWLQHLQVGAASVPIVQHPIGANKETKTEALEIAKMIRNGAYGRIPENFKLVWAESQKGAENAQAYQNFIRTCDDQISKCVNGQTLTSEAGSVSGKGTQALGEVHQATQTSRTVFRAHGFEATMNASPVRWCVDLNFANVEGYPKFRFDLEDPEDLKQEAEIVKLLSEAGYEIPEDELSAKFNYTLTKKQPLNLTPTKPEELPIEPEETEEENAEGQVATA